jgi:hypothetical protein
MLVRGSRGSTHHFEVKKRVLGIQINLRNFEHLSHELVLILGGENRGDCSGGDVQTYFRVSQPPSG